MIKIGDSVVIKENLVEKLIKLEFDDHIIEMMKKLIGNKYFVYDIWNDKQTNQEYVTVDLCLEIPIQCLENYKQYKQ